MSTAAAAPEASEAAELRQRAPHGVSSGEKTEGRDPGAADPVLDIDDELSALDKGKKKTFGRTPDGTGKLAPNPLGSVESRGLKYAHIQPASLHRPRYS